MDLYVGIGVSQNASEHAKWGELWTWYEQGELLGGLWLGACRTRAAATAFTPFLQTAERIVIPYIYSFSDPHVESLATDFHVFLAEGSRETGAVH